MKITHFLARFRIADGGVVRAVLDICTLLAARGHDVTVLTCDDTDVPDGWKNRVAGSPRVVCVPFPAGILGQFTKRQLAGLKPMIAASGVLHLHGCWELANAQCARMARRLGVPYVISVHGMLDDWSMAQKRIKKRIFLAAGGRQTLEHAALVHCTAAAEFEQSRKWYPRAAGIVVPLVFALEPYRLLPGPEAAEMAFGLQAKGALRVDSPLLLFLSRVHPKKGIEVLIDAVAELRRRGVACQALIAGSGDPRYVAEIQERIRHSELDDWITSVGLVTGATKVSLFQAASMLVVPTSQENFGFVFLESLASETPVVTTRGVDIWPELEESGGAMIVDRSAQAFADVVETLLADPERLQRMGVQGRHWVFEHFDPEAIGRQFDAMYTRAAARTPIS